MADEDWPAVSRLSRDELCVIAVSSGCSYTVAHMGAVCRAWHEAAASAAVWDQIADCHWLGAIHRGPFRQQRLQALDSAARRVSRGDAWFALIVEQNGHLQLCQDRAIVSLGLAPFRLIAMFRSSGARTLTVSITANSDPSLHSAPTGKPLAQFAAARLYEEEDEEAEIAILHWEAQSSPGPGLLIDKSRHQCFWWDPPPSLGPPVLGDGTACSTELRTPPWADQFDSQSTTGADGCTSQVVMCRTEVTHLKIGAQASAWQGLEEIDRIAQLPPLPTHPASALLHREHGCARQRTRGDEREDSCGRVTMPIHCIALHQKIEVGPTEQGLRQRELQREMFSLELTHAGQSL